MHSVLKEASLCAAVGDHIQIVDSANTTANPPLLGKLLDGR